MLKNEANQNASKTTIPFQDAILRDPDFVRGKYDTGFVARFLESGVAKLRH